MLYAFDLDGTLIDNRVAVHDAYVAAGVAVPTDFFEVPSKEWPVPPTDAQKEMKAKFYSRMLQKCRKGPALPLWHSLHRDEKMIITGASKLSARVSLSFLAIDSVYMMCGKTLEEKAHNLRMLGGFHGFDSVFYIDANVEVCREVAKKASITSISFFKTYAY